VSDRYASYPDLTLDEPDERILRITLNVPGKLNAVGHEMHRQLSEIWVDISRDPDVDVVLIRGEGRAFSAGGDLTLVEDIANDFATRARVLGEARDLVYNVINCTKPVVSAMHGPAVGAGLAVGLLADISIAARSARIIDGHTRLGVAAGDHAAIVWPLLCGLAKAKYYLMLCDPITGEEAERIGLVSRCVDDDKLQDEALEVARRLQRGSRSAIRWTKLTLNNWLRAAGPTFDASLAYEFLGFSGPDVREGLDSLRGRREPVFTDRSLIEPAVIAPA
jgi:enoyl-CoA hydratase